jgi:hypothetical protein
MSDIAEIKIDVDAHLCTDIRQRLNVVQITNYKISRMFHTAIFNSDVKPNPTVEFTGPELEKRARIRIQILEAWAELAIANYPTSGSCAFQPTVHKANPRSDMILNLILLLQIVLFFFTRV